MCLSYQSKKASCRKALSRRIFRLCPQSPSANFCIGNQILRILLSVYKMQPQEEFDI